MENQMVMWPMISRDSERSSRGPNTRRVQYRENSWRCYLATIANYYTVSKKTTQLWNGITGNYMDRFWWHLAEIFKRLPNRVCMFQLSCRFAFYQVIVSQTVYWKQHMHTMHFSQLLSAPFLAALETQIFVNNQRTTDDRWIPPPHVKFLWLFGGSSWLSNSDSTVWMFSSECALRLPLTGRLSSVPNFTRSQLMLFVVQPLFRNFVINSLSLQLLHSYRFLIKILSHLLNSVKVAAFVSVSSLEDEKLIKSKPTWKLKHANAILESFEYFCQISSKSILIISC